MQKEKVVQLNDVFRIVLTWEPSKCSSGWIACLQSGDDGNWRDVTRMDASWLDKVAETSQKAYDIAKDSKHNWWPKRPSVVEKRPDDFHASDCGGYHCSRCGSCDGGSCICYAR